LVLTPGTWTISNNVTLTQGLRIPYGATLSIDSGKTLTINGPLEAGLYQIFSGSGTVSFGTGALDRVYPQWWGGPDIADGSTDATPSIQLAEDALETMTDEGTLYFPPGKYAITHSNTLISIGGTYKTALIIRKSNITWQGAGKSSILYVANWQIDTTLQNYITVYDSTGNIGNVIFRDLQLLGAEDKDSTIGDSDTPTWFIQIGGSDATRTVSNSGFENIYAEKTSTPFVFNGGSNDPSSGNQCENNFVINCDVNNGCYGAINAVSGGHANTTITNNRIKDTRGIAIEWSSMRAIITNNTITETFGSAISFEGATTQTGYSVIANNTIMDVGKHASGTSGPAIQIGQVTGKNRLLIQNNVMKDVYGQGIVVGGAAATDIIVRGNIVDGFGKDGENRTLGSPALGWTGINVANRTRVYVLDNIVVALEGADDNCDYGIISGGGSATDYITDRNIVVGSYDVASFDMKVDLGQGATGGSGVITGPFNLDFDSRKYHPIMDSNSKIPQLADDATPSIAGSDVWRTGGTTTITDFDDGYTSQIITVNAEHSLVITDGTNIFLRGGGNFNMVSKDTLTLLCKADNKWYERGRSENSVETVTAASPTLSMKRCTKIDSTSNAVNATLGSGQYIGQIKVIVMIEASNASTVTVTNHNLSDGEVFDFKAVDAVLVLMWIGTEWITLKEEDVGRTWA
jgi:hypothetical protein